MQITNYLVYLSNHALGLDPSKGKWRLKAIRHSKGLKKIEEALNTLLGVEGVGTKVPHLEEEDIF